MSNQVSRSALLKAVKIIRTWHDMNDPNPDPEIFKIYYERSPEMEMIRNELGSYDKMKHEVITATSKSIKNQ